MKKITYAAFTMAAASVFCILTGKLSEIIFLSAIFSVALSIFRNEWLDSVLLWAIAFYLLIIPVFLGIYANFFISTVIAHSSYLFLSSIEGNLNLIPGKKIDFINLPERAVLFASSALFFITFLFI